ncbi:MAG TPA: phosphate ABC transporter permease PstA [Thermoplasmata archaeon]|nr:phosphate ABC transporter permease PstA [Thermoplasmata archaeon]
MTEWAFIAGFVAAIGIAVGALVVLLGSIVVAALPRLTPAIVFNYSNSTNPATAGYAAAIVGTLWIVGLTLLFSLPLGIAAGIYLQEYGGRGILSRILQAGVANLAGVPSVVFGLLGLAVFVRALGMGPVVLAGALTMTMLVFPYVVITTQEAVRAVPQSIRDAALALGSTKWQAIRRQVLPAAAPGLLTGAILAAARAIGETAPLLVIGALFLQTFIPYGPDSPFVALPVQIYAYTILPVNQWGGVAAAGMVVLLGVLFSFNAVAVIARNRLQRQRW